MIKYDFANEKNLTSNKYHELSLYLNMFKNIYYRSQNFTFSTSLTDAKEKKHYCIIPSEVHS